MLLKKNLKRTALSILITNAVIPSAYAAKDNSLPHYKHLIESTLKQIERTKSDTSAYKTTKIENINGDVSNVIATYDPRRKPQTPWHLITIDGDKPSKDQKEDFLISIDDSKPTKLNDFIDINSLKLKEDGENTITFYFEGRNKKFGDSVIGKLDGTIVLDKRENTLLSMIVVNNSKFSSKYTVDISHWSMKFEFARHGGFIIQTSQKAEMKGTIALFVDLDVNASVAYSNYEHFFDQSLTVNNDKQIK